MIELFFIFTSVKKSLSTLNLSYTLYLECNLFLSLSDSFVFFTVFNSWCNLNKIKDIKSFGSPELYP